MTLEAKIMRRRDVLKAERAEHAKYIEHIDQELADLDAAERVIERLGADGAQTELGVTITDEQAPEPVEFQGTKKDLVLEILGDVYPLGLASSGIRLHADIVYGTELNANTLTVTLNRLKEEKAVRLDGRTWFLVPKRSVTSNVSLRSTIEQAFDESTEASASAEASETGDKAPSSSG